MLSQCADVSQPVHQGLLCNLLVFRQTNWVKGCSAQCSSQGLLYCFTGKKVSVGVYQHIAVAKDKQLAVGLDFGNGAHADYASLSMVDWLLQLLDPLLTSAP